QFHRIERPRGVGPVERADQPLVAVVEQLPSYRDRGRGRLAAADLHVGLAHVEGIAVDARCAFAANAGRSRILTLEKELEPRFWSDGHIQPRARQAVGVVAPFLITES